MPNAVTEYLEKEPEEVPEEDEEIEEPPKKRKVTGRIPKTHRFIGRSREEYIAQRQPQQPVVQPYYAQTPRQPPESNFDLERRAKNEARVEIMKQMELQRFYQQQARAQQPRVTTSQKLLNVANNAAGTRGGNKINMNNTKGLLNKPNVTPIRSTKSIANNFSNYVQSVAPKIKTSKKKK